MEIHGHLWSFVLPKMYIHLCYPKNRMSLFSRSQVRFPKKGHAFSEKRTCDFESIINPPFSRSKKVSFLAWQGTLSQVSSLNLRLSIRHISTISISFSNRLLFCHLAGF